MDVREKTVTGMADMMNFPKRWEDFLHDYEFEDARRIYTNGSRLIQSFRVKQMMEHYAPVRHGRWVQVIVHVETDDGFVDRVEECCSACHEPNGRRCTYFCPNCGAKMHGGED